MSKVTETVEVPKELNEVRKALVKVIQVSKEALKDGFQPGQDLPTIAISSYQDLILALQGFNEIPAEVKTDLGSSVKCIGLMAGDLVEVLVK